jgi:hypothetical protein
VVSNAAYQVFGASLRNTVWSWSARTPDGTVVLGLWRDRFQESKTPIEYHERGDDEPAIEWCRRLGNRDRKDHLAWAKSHCGGKFRVVMATARNTQADPREGSTWCPRPDLLMEITYIRPTGQFGAKVIEGVV